MFDTNARHVNILCLYFRSSSIWISSYPPDFILILTFSLTSMIKESVLESHSNPNTFSGPPSPEPILTSSESSKLYVHPLLGILAWSQIPSNCLVFSNASAFLKVSKLLHHFLLMHFYHTFKDIQYHLFKSSWYVKVLVNCVKLFCSLKLYLRVWNRTLWTVANVSV